MHHIPISGRDRKMRYKIRVEAQHLWFCYIFKTNDRLINVIKDLHKLTECALRM